MKIIVFVMVLIMSFSTSIFAVNLEQLDAELAKYTNGKTNAETVIERLEEQLARRTLLRNKLQGAIEAIQFLKQQETDSLAATKALEKVQDEQSRGT